MCAQLDGDQYPKLTNADPMGFERVEGMFTNPYPKRKATDPRGD